MNTFDWLISPLDSVIARDGRPFGATSGNRIRSLGWPLPSTTAGTVRTLLGSLDGGEFGEKEIKALKNISIAGPLGSVDGRLLLPAARDLVFSRDWGAFRLRPRRRSGTDLPAGMLPAVMDEPGEEDFKADEVAAWWPAATMTAWLCDHPVDFSVPAAWRLLKDTRTHVAIQSDTGTAEDELLFQTTGLTFDRLSIALRVSDPGDLHHRVNDSPLIHPLGGERRLSEWTKREVDGWLMPDQVHTSLLGSRRIRMVLATPAIFKHGWRPGWLDEDLTGVIPSSEIPVRLVSAICSRWEPVSGWSYDKRDDRKRQKYVRRMVPSGSVYFFERTDSEPFPGTLPWLGPVSDDPQDCNDGFGLALWGTWEFSKEDM